VLILVFAVVLKPIFPLVDYAVNYNYIAKVLCVNKTKPILKCNGKCHLMKELAKAADSESTGEKSPSSDKKSSSKQEVETLYFQEVNFLQVNPISTQVLLAVCDSYCNLYSNIGLSAVFHPPTLI
jgi:hypothetical protein